MKNTYGHLVLLALGGLAVSAGCASTAPSGPDCQATDLASRLACLPGASLEYSSQCAGPPHEATCYALTFDQPVDHQAPGGAHFSQRVMLRHISESAPVVLTSTGYALGADPELANYFDVNTVEIEHRFFGESVPAPPAWGALTIAQAAADYHRVIVALKSIYGGRWLSTGSSKGGEAAVFHRRFYPDDVGATLAEGTPNVHGLADPRFVSFVGNLGGDDRASCRSALFAVQQAVLTRRSEILPLMVGDFNTLGKDVALEHAVLELPFTFWAHGASDDPANGCPGVPVPDAPAPRLFEFLSSGAMIQQSYTDASIATMAPFAYQAATQLGSFGVNDAALVGLLRYRATYTPSTYAPPGVETAFDPDAMPDVQRWVSAEGRSMMFVYGDHDPWRAAAYDLGAATDSFTFVAPNVGHSELVRRLADPDRAQALAILGRWLGVPLRTTNVAPPPSIGGPAPPPVTLQKRSRLAP